jgi:hypothetical protein
VDYISKTDQIRASRPDHYCSSSSNISGLQYGWTALVDMIRTAVDMIRTAVEYVLRLTILTLKGLQW